VRRYVATDLEHDLGATPEPERARVASATDAVDEHGDGAVERNELTRPEPLAPDAEKTTESNAPSRVADDTTGIERPDPGAAPRAHHAAQPEMCPLEPDRSRDDDDASPREQFEVNARTGIEPCRAAGEARGGGPGRRPIAGPRSYRRRHETQNDGSSPDGESTQTHRQQATRAVICLLVCALAVGIVTPVARADGDPASDYLVSQQVFLSYDAKIPPALQRKLVAAVASANKQGFPLRVALIWSSYDLGSLAGLFGQPRGYARFLDIEDSKCWWGGSCSGGRFKTTTRLLVVMPNGLGFAQWKHNPAPGYRALAGIKVVRTPAGLATAATEAVVKLAAASGVKVSTAGGSVPRDQSTSGTNRIEIIVAVILAIVLGVAALFLIRRRAARSTLR
jgi:hypothetical protein